MATSEGRAKQFINAVEKAAEAAMDQLKIEANDIDMQISVDVNTSISSLFPKQGG